MSKIFSHVVLSAKTGTFTEYYATGCATRQDVLRSYQCQELAAIGGNVRVRIDHYLYGTNDGLRDATIRTTSTPRKRE